MHLYLGIDFGTTGVRTSVINEKKEELINYSVSIETVSYTHLTLPTIE